MRRTPRETEALSFLGLARRAGAVAIGVEATRHSLNVGEAELVLLAGDASKVQLDKVRRLLRHHDIPVRWVSDRDALGRALGEGPLSVVGVKTRSFATQLLRRLPEDAPDSPERGVSKGAREERGPDAGC